MLHALHSVSVESLEQRTLLSTFVVTNTHDHGFGSLRQAINASNGHAGADKISFNIPGAGVHVIMPSPDLPSITDPVTIDGYTQPGAAPNTLSQGDNAKLLIELNGAKNPNGGVGIEVATGPGASATTIRGLIINGWQRADVPEVGEAIAVDQNSAIIIGNFLGTDATGAHAVPNGEGIDAEVPISARIGGTVPADVNLISGNVVGIFGETNLAGEACVIEGNLIGTDASGHHRVGNTTGVLLRDAGVGNLRVGGTSSAARNIISGNNVGLSVGNFSGTPLIEGNFIGTDVSGTAALANRIGVNVNSGTGIRIGSTARGARNVISGNGTGVRVFASTDCAIIGNFIGTDASGTKAVGNGGDGVLIQTDPSGTSSHRNRVGGTNAGEGNVIAFNGKSGVGVTIPKKHAGTVNELNAIRGNKIFSNKGLGIDLRDDGVTPNDHGDGDSGPNNLQNFPVITSATRLSSSIVVKGTLDSKPGTSYIIDVYASDTVGASAQAQAKDYLGSITITTNASGLGIFSKTFSAASKDLYVTATATTLLGTPAGDTSEFAAPVLAQKFTGRRSI